MEEKPSGSPPPAGSADAPGPASTPAPVAAAAVTPTETKKPAPPARKPRKPRPKALINENGCTGCEECITVCPIDCIVKIPNPALPEINPICRVDWDRCTGCTICVRDCPWETIEMVFPNAEETREKIEAFPLEDYGTEFIPEWQAAPA